jgi:hypothetical protein
MNPHAKIEKLLQTVFSERVVPNGYEWDELKI